MVRDLLQHQSGLSDYADDPAFLKRTEAAKRWKPLDTLRFAASKPLLFSARHAMALLQHELHRARAHRREGDGPFLRELLHQRILGPLRLRATELPATAHPRDIADAGDNPRVSWADGALVSNAADLARFSSALLGGRLLSRTTLAQMEHTVPVPTGNPIFDGDGLGLFSSAQQCGRFWGHSGGILYSLTGALCEPGRQPRRDRRLPRPRRGRGRRHDVPALLLGATPW